MNYMVHKILIRGAFIINYICLCHMQNNILLHFRYAWIQFYRLKPPKSKCNWILCIFVWCLLMWLIRFTWEVIIDWRLLTRRVIVLSEECKKRRSMAFNLRFAVQTCHSWYSPDSFLLKFQVPLVFCIFHLLKHCM